AKVADNTVEKDDDGFTKVTRKNGKGKQDGKPMTNGNKGQALPMMRLRMYSLALWNIKGMNQATKQKEVCHVIYDNNLCLCTTLESHVANSNLQGDFNVSQSVDDKSTGTSYIDTGMRDFQECVEDLELSDVNSTGLRFTWNQKPKVEMKTSVSGFWMFRVVKRLKLLKKPLRKLLYDHGNFHENVKRLRHELDEAQKALDLDPSNFEFREEKAAYLQVFNDASLMEEWSLSQKAKVDWLQLGDVNTAYFHKVVKSHASKNRIDSVITAEGICVDSDQLTNDTANHMVRDVTDKENRDAIFSMGDNKAPGLDGVLFKYISRIISNYMKESLSDLVSLNQSTFVHGRRISDNILLTQELMHNYHLDRGTPRCAFKVDIQKAYDTVDWRFLHDVLVGFSINGYLHGYFKGERGLRHGDPMSPYLFTLVMEVLILMLHQRARESNSFTYHRYCSKLNIINLCFADDLFLFAHGDVNSARVIMDSLEEFKNASGLTFSLPKSTAYFCNVLNHVKLDILNILPFEEGKLHVKYLDVPLVLSRLVHRNCSKLIKKVKRRISDWKNKSLSLVGRAQLIHSVLSFIHIYWALVFILPTSLMVELEQVMRGFLWCQSEMHKGRAKVAWEDVCLPKDEGGLGIRRLETFNKALISSHIWSLLSHRESLWVKWIHDYKLKGRTFWEMPNHGRRSWGWRKILQVRQLVRPFIWYRLGNGAMTSAWFDNWCSIGP
ncbi:hypothetical protein Tco_1288910, partial [Tanacetum coccineum]